MMMKLKFQKKSNEKILPWNVGYNGVCEFVLTINYILTSFILIMLHVLYFANFHCNYQTFKRAIVSKTNYTTTKK